MQYFCDRGQFLVAFNEEILSILNFVRFYTYISNVIDLH